MPAGSRRHDSVLQPGALVVDSFASLIDRIFSRGSGPLQVYQL